MFMLLENPWQEDNFQFANLPFEREKNPLTKGFYDFTDIRKLQDKAKASHKLSAVLL